MSTAEVTRASLIPTPAELIAQFKEWLRVNGRWWALSVGGHILLIAPWLLIAVPLPSINADAPAFDAKLEKELGEPELTKFEVGEAPLEPTVLDTESLSMVEAPQIEQAEEFNDNSAVFEHAGGGMANTKVPNIGGLGGFDIKAIGPGPAVRGPGGVGVGQGTGTGPGSGGAGSGFGGRGSGSRKAMVGGFGGTKQTERAVAAGLSWLARHQNPDGSWTIDHFDKNCKDGHCSGTGNVNSDSAATAFALLPFLAAGQTHQTKGPYQQTIARGINWLMTHQGQDGGLMTGGGQMYSHGLAAITLCEAYGLTNPKDNAVGKSAQAAIRYIEAAQSKKTGSWVYQPAPQGDSGDTSVFGWQLMALKSAQMANLEVQPATLEGARKWLKAASKGNKGGLFCYNVATGPSDTMTSVGLLCTQYLGAGRSDEAIVEGMNYLMARLPSASGRNCYYWYYATQVLHNLPGPEWDQWNREMRRTLIEQQTKEGCATGSWDPEKPAPDAHSKPGGRIMLTSIALLTLEVYYRYLPLYQLDGSKSLASAEMKK